MVVRLVQFSRSILGQIKLDLHRWWIPQNVIKRPSFELMRICCRVATPIDAKRKAENVASTSTDTPTALAKVRILLMASSAQIQPVNRDGRGKVALSDNKERTDTTLCDGCLASVRHDPSSSNLHSSLHCDRTGKPSWARRARG